MKTIKMDDIDYTKASEASALAHEFMGKIIVQSESAFDLWYKKVQ